MLPPSLLNPLGPGLSKPCLSLLFREGRQAAFQQARSERHGSGIQAQQRAH